MRDSSLSACTQAVMAAEVGHLDLAYDYLGEAALMDLRDLEHNTRDGVHIASLAGTWIALVGGFGGLRHEDGTVSFAPRLPGGPRQARVQPRHPGAAAAGGGHPRHGPYSLTDGEPLEIVHHGEKVALSAGKPQTRPVQADAGPAPPQPAARTGACAPRAQRSRDLTRHFAQAGLRAAAAGILSAERCQRFSWPKSVCPESAAIADDSAQSK